MPALQGQPAPAFSLPMVANGAAPAPVSLADFAGKRLVLYFYPKDDTPGCTLEAQDFSRLADDFAAAGVAVLGVSKDSATAHEKFCRKHSLTIPLASDEAGTTCEDYGVWVEKNMYGKTYFGIERATFLIGPDGVIEQVWRKVSAKGHAEDVLAAVTG